MKCNPSAGCITTAATTAKTESQNGIRCKPLAGCFVSASHHSRCIAGGRGPVLHEMPESGQIVCSIEPRTSCSLLHGAQRRGEKRNLPALAR